MTAGHSVATILEQEQRFAPALARHEQQWFGSLYVLASSHRTDGSLFAVAPGIVWPVTNDAPAFRGAMTMNYNQEALYYGAC